MSQPSQDQTTSKDYFLSGLRVAQISILLVLIYLLTNVHTLIVSFLVSLNSSANQTQLLISEQRAFLKQQQDLWNNPKTQESIGLLLRQGNEFAKFMDSSQGAAREGKILIKDLQGTAKEVNSLVKDLREKTLVDISSLISEATKTLEVLASKSGKTLDGSTEAIKALKELLQNKNVLDALANVKSITGNIDKTSASVALSAEDLQEGLPALVKTFQEIARNISETTQEIKTFSTQFNKPTPAYVKVLRYIVAVLAPALPVLLKR
jgi:methyl-accepting chemotaxis protein